MRHCSINLLQSSKGSSMPSRIILLNIKKMAKSFICINFAFNINLLTNGNR